MYNIYQDVFFLLKMMMLFAVSLAVFKRREQTQREIPEITVELCFRGKKKRLAGFYDTGNLLREPLTGKMVHIASYKEIRELLPEEYQKTAEHFFETGYLESTKVTELQMYEFTFLSYHSIGNETGQLLGIRMDRAVFFTPTGKRTEERAVIALTQQELFVRKRSRILINGRMEL